MRRTMITMTLATLLTACATTSGTGPDIYTSGFDNSTLVEIAPHGAACRPPVLDWEHNGTRRMEMKPF